MNKKVVEIIILKMIKMTVNPRIKQPVVINRTNLLCFSEFIPPAAPRIPKYDGISGRTQGDKNERSPAAKTSNTKGYSTIK
jgi:hypothetical protein